MHFVKVKPMRELLHCHLVAASAWRAKSQLHTVDHAVESVTSTHCRYIGCGRTYCSDQPRLDAAVHKTSPREQCARESGPVPAAMTDAQNNMAHSEQDELEYLSSATLTKRKDFIDREEEARNAPNRVLYYRRNADNDRLIQVCTDKLQANPKNVRALLIRAASYVKTGTHAL